MGVNAPGLGGPWGGLRARAEVTDERVPFLEIVSEPLAQGRVRGAMASSLVIKEVTMSETGSHLEAGKFLHAFSYSPLLPLQLLSLKSNDVSTTAHSFIR